MLRGSIAAAGAIAAILFASTAQAAGLVPSLVTNAPQVGVAPSFTLDGQSLPHPVWHHMMLPGEKLELGLAPGQTATLDGKPVTAWTAGRPGNHELLVQGPAGERVAEVTVFVMRPSSEIDARGYLGDFRIGTYPNGTTPRGFIQLASQADMDLRVSPHFTVGQFICKQQPGEWPKYLLVSGDNLERLETLLAGLRQDDLTDADTLFVMSGWRSPFYNSAIGSAKLSRHMYGDAADVYIDHAPRDGNMDDINGDGQVTKADANFLYDYSEELFAEEDVEQGGLGSYKANAVHGPFVHVDARGRIARWGR